MIIPSWSNGRASNPIPIYRLCPRPTLPRRIMDQQLQQPQPADAVTPAPYGRACVNCSRAKCKCLFRAGADSCERFATLLFFLLSFVLSSPHVEFDTCQYLALAWLFAHTRSHTCIDTHTCLHSHIIVLHLHLSTVGRPGVSSSTLACLPPVR